MHTTKWNIFFESTNVHTDTKINENHDTNYTMLTVNEPGREVHFRLNSSWFLASK